MRMDRYVANTLRVSYEYGISNYVRGVYSIVVGLLGLVGCIGIGVARLTMLNRSAKEYLIAKKRRPPDQLIGPVFVTLMEHPHKRSDAKLPEWRPLELPSVLQDRKLLN